MKQHNFGYTAERRKKAYISTFGATQLHLTNPFVIAWWSAAFPGLGHILLSKYLRGYALFIWEVVVNYNAHINLAILYSFTGRFEEAKNVIDLRWMLLYIPTYVFAIWDSYRTAVDLNHSYILAAREDAAIKPFAISSLEINYLDKRTPWISAVWSLIAPGTGQLYGHRIIIAFFLMIWWITIVYLSKLFPAIHLTMLGRFEEVKSIVDPHWFLNITSIHLFSMYDAYTSTVENNNLFEWEQARFLKRFYQAAGFPMPFGKLKRGDNLYIFSTFEHSINLEMAVTAIQMKGIEKENILAVPMDKRGEKARLFDTLHFSDGLSLLDFPAITGSIFMLLGSIYGFVLKWGPVLWGLIGLVAGFGLGLAVKLLTARKYGDRQSGNKSSEVILIIKCGEDQQEMVKETLWSNFALGVSRLSLN